MLDPFVRLRGARIDESSQKDVGPVLDFLGKLRDESGAAVIYSHHTGHQGSHQRGSSAAQDVDLLAARGPPDASGVIAPSGQDELAVRAEGGVVDGAAVDLEGFWESRFSGGHVRDKLVVVTAQRRRPREPICELSHENARAPHNRRPRTPLHSSSA
jgi:hypothetical protein